MGGARHVSKCTAILGCVCYYVRLCALSYYVVCAKSELALVYCNFLKEVRIGG